MSYEFGLSSLKPPDPTEQITLEVVRKALEYARLAAVLHPSEKQAERMGEILEEAIDNEVLDFWITEIERDLSHQLRLFDEGCLKDYKDEQALFQEYFEVGIEEYLVPKEQQIPHYLAPLSVPNLTSPSSFDSLPSSKLIEEAKRLRNESSSSDHDTSDNQKRH